MNNNIIRIPVDDQAHERLRTIKKALKPEKRLIGEIASRIINSGNLDALIKAEKKHAARKEAK